MKNSNTDKFKSLVSDEKSGWLDKAKWRHENQDWLDISFDISIKILSKLRANKESENFPKNQKELAESLNCTPQYVNKLLKGSEKLNIETISKIQKALEIQIINTSPEETQENDNFVTFIFEDDRKKERDYEENIYTPSIIRSRDFRKKLKELNYTFSHIRPNLTITSKHKTLVCGVSNASISSDEKKSHKLISFNSNIKTEYCEFYTE